MMENNIILEEGGDPIRFTPDGKVAVMDAVRALGDSDHWTALWDRVVSENPDILRYCETYHFENETGHLVVDSEGWERIAILLFESMSDADLAVICGFDSR